MTVPQAESLRNRVSVDRLFRDSLSSFVRKKATATLIEELEDHGPGYDAQDWSDLARIGVLGLLATPSPAEPGGQYAAMSSAAAILGASTLPSPLHETAVEAVLVLATAGRVKDVRVNWLTKIAAGEAIVVPALNEPGHEIALQETDVSATMNQGRWLITGTKRPVAYAHAADAIIVVARIGDTGERGLFLVPSRARGIRVDSMPSANGYHLASITFDAAVVDADSRLDGDEVTSQMTIDMTISVAAVMRASQLLALGSRALSLTLKFAEDRVQFGRPIGRFQVVQRHCADMYVFLEKIRVLLAQAVVSLETGAEIRRNSSIVKVAASEYVPQVLERAHQVHGGVGFYRDYPLERIFRRVMEAEAAAGSARWHRARLTEMLRSDEREFRRGGSHALAT
jgi:alkylation response protein AidB-like acyl-CoA dehydrogenase